MRYYLLNKPTGYITACRDANRKTVMELFPPDVAKGLHPVGRLDRDTVGVLLFTDDGLADISMLTPSRHVEKEYFFWALGEIDEEKISKMENGLTLPSGETAGRVAFTLEKTAKVSDIEELLPENRRARYMKNPNGSAFCATLVLCEGKKHEVKLLLRAVGCRVVFLERRRFGEISLPSDLGRGEYRPLDGAEIAYVEKCKEIYEKTVKNE